MHHVPTRPAKLFGWDPFQADCGVARCELLPVTERRGVACCVVEFFYEVMGSMAVSHSGGDIVPL